MIELKDDSINLSGMSPQILLALMVAENVYASYGTEVVITSVNDANHSSTSLHYSGNAVDIRVWNLPEEVAPSVVADEIKAALNQHFDVLFEGDHIHIEYQPRNPQHA